MSQLNHQKSYLIVLGLITLILASCLLVAFVLNQDAGRVNVSTVTIPAGDFTVSGLLYEPLVAGLSPGVVLMHGVSNSKEVLSGFALELAKQGIVALTIDALGHGESGGTLDQGRSADPSLGMVAAYGWLGDHSSVDPTLIGVMGHSMGGSAAVEAVQVVDPKAVVLLGGGLFNSSVDPLVLNVTHPRNLLVVIGEQDVLFDLEVVKEDLLPSVFGQAGPIKSGVTYGSFVTNTARRLATPTTSHLFEPVTPAVVGEVTDWFVQAFGVPSQGTSQSFLFRDLALVVSLVLFVSALLPLSSVVLVLTNHFLPPSQNQSLPSGMLVSSWLVMGFWGIIGLVLFLPALLFFGSYVPIPPLYFGSSFAWWLFLVGLVGLLVLFMWGERIHQSLSREHLLPFLRSQVCLADVVVGVLVVAVAFAAVSVVEWALVLNFRLVVPLIQTSGQLGRYLAFVSFVPFSLFFFFVEGLVIHRIREDPQDPSKDNVGPFSSWLLALAVKNIPYIALLLLFYIPLFALGFSVVPGQLGFFVEFLVLVVPIFLISTTYSWWLYRQSGRVGAGAVVNGLLVAWLASALFPLMTIG